MLDTTETLGAMAAWYTFADGDQPTAAKAMVPMLDWPTDLFDTFTAEIDDSYD